MTRDLHATVPTDAELVAYLDGELSPADSVRIGQRLATDPALAARMDHLMKGGRPFREAFDPLLAEAPVGRLDDMLTAILTREAAPPRRLRWVPVQHWPAMAAAAVALIVFGAGLDRVVMAPASTAFFGSTHKDESEDWRRAVAQYLSLYTQDTLSVIADAGDPNRQALASAGEKLGLNLVPARVELPNLTLKRADTYSYDGKPIAFLAYLDPQNGPVALCITQGDRGSDAQRLERRRGMNVVYWSQGRHNFMLIGRTPSGQLQTLATMVASRFDEKTEERG